MLGGKKRNLNQEDEYDPIHSCLVTDIYIRRLYLMLLKSTEQWSGLSDHFCVHRELSCFLRTHISVMQLATHLWTIFYYPLPLYLPSVFLYCDEPLANNCQSFQQYCSSHTIRKLLDSLIQNSLERVPHSVSTTILAIGLIGKWLLTCIYGVCDIESKKWYDLMSLHKNLYSSETQD